MSDNTSEKPGFLTPTSGPVEDPELTDTISATVVGTTGLSAQLVRPRWQIVPPNQPSASTNWCSVGIIRRSPIDYPYFEEFGNPENPFAPGSGRMTDYEELEIIISFYGPRAGAYAGILRRGLNIGQNRDLLGTIGIKVSTIGDVTAVPDLINMQYIDHVDLRVTMTRENVADFNASTILDADMELTMSEPGSGYGLTSDEYNQLLAMINALAVSLAAFAATETAARVAGDATNADAITNEIEARTAAVAGVQTGLDAQAALRIKAGVPYPRKIVWVGDSILARSSEKPPASTSPNILEIGPIGFLAGMSRGKLRFRINDNFAVGGSTIHSEVVTDPAQLDAALASCVPGDLVWFEGGVNTYTNSNAIPFGQPVIDDIQILLDKCIENKQVRLIVQSPAMRYSWDDPEQAHSFFAHRQYLLEFCYQNGCEFADYTAETIDWNANPPRGLPGLTFDGLHPSTKGNVHWARFAGRILSKYLPTFQSNSKAISVYDMAPGPVAKPNPYGAIVGSAFMAGTGGTISGPPVGGSVSIVLGTIPEEPDSTPGFAAGWRFQYLGDNTGGGAHALTGSVVLAKGTHPDGRPCQIAQFRKVKGGTNREGFRFLRDWPNTDGFLQPGDRIRCVGEYSVIGPARTASLSVSITGTTPVVGAVETLTVANDSGVPLTIDSAVTEGSQFTIAVTDENVVGSPFTFVYTAIGGDTPGTVATALFALLGAATALTSSGYHFTLQATGVTIYGVTDHYNTCTIATTGPETVSARGSPGMYGNFPKANEPGVGGVWQTPILTLPAVVPTTASVSEVLIIYMDTTLPDIPEENTVTVYFFGASTHKIPDVVGSL